MDTSENMEYLEDSSTMPELSFDDLLDPSPIKKNIKPNDDDDDLELNRRIDDTLNTPGPKKPPIIQRNTTTSISITGASKSSTPVRTQAVKLGSSSNIMTNVIKNNSGTTTTTVPVLLNTKNILPKNSAQISNNSIKLTPKTVTNNNTSTTSLTITGKTAARTSNGQIIYIQKTASSSNMKAATSSNLVKSQTSTANNPKPMTIQVLRTADGNYVPIKSATAGSNVKNTALTLSPTSLAGKKILTSAGGQVIIKGPIKTTDSIANTVTNPKTNTTNTINSVKTIVKPTISTSATNDSNKSKPIVVHGTGGKQILVSNQNIVKLSPKPQSITTIAGGQGASTTTTSGTGQLHAIQIPGKLGVQYVRVLPSTKIATKTLNPTSTSAPSTTSAVTTVSKTLNTTNQPVKILNSLPQKFAVVQKVGTTKLLVTQKKDTTTSNNTGDNNSSVSKIQKTIVTVPTIKSLNDDKYKNHQTQQQQQALTKSTQQSLLAGNNNLNQQTLIRKHKISDINTEIQRITTTSDNPGPPEVKKSAPNNRVVVISSNNQPKILNSSIQQPGRITTTLTLPSQTKTTTNSSGGSVVQATSVTQNGNKLYKILKPSVQEQKPAPKLYSVLKTNNNQMTTTSSSSVLAVSGVSTSTTASNAGAGASVKPLINKQYLIQQQHKLLQQKQQQNATNQSIDSLNAKTTTLTKYVLPVKIKEEPADTNLNANSNNNNSTDFVSSTSISLPMGKDDVDAIDPLVGGVRRKHCNCSKSQCLKLYCDCFANGEFCQDCTCKDCFNNLENEDERQRAIKSCLERNPNAFKPKITSSRDQADMRLHNKGCNCKRSGCLKNYCECYEAKIPCSSNCKCVGCRNVEDRPDLDMDPIDPKIMASIAMASGETASTVTQKRSYEKSQRELSGAMPAINIKTEKLSKDNLKSFAGIDHMTGAASPTLERQQCNFITQEVIDATIQCMITQADECEKNGLPSYQTEKMIMEELGRCLVEIIDFSIRNTDNSYSQD